MNKRFDVFLSHNSKDKPAVRELAEALRARGLGVWLDEWELIPGRPWQEALEAIIETTQSAAVLVGKDGLGPWQDAEMRACLEEFVDRKLPVIPVLLPSAPEKPKLPLFLKRFTWVDLRGGLTEEGIDRLQWGATGKRLDRSKLPSIPSTSPKSDLPAAEAQSVYSKARPASPKVKPSAAIRQIKAITHGRRTLSFIAVTIVSICVILVVLFYFGPLQEAFGSIDDIGLLFDESSPPATPLEEYDKISSLAASHDGHSVVGITPDRILIWDRPSGKLLRRFSGEDLGTEFNSLSLRSRDNLIAVGDGSRNNNKSSSYFVRLFDFFTGRETTAGSHKSEIQALAFNPEGDFLYSVSLDGAIGSWKLKEARYSHIYSSPSSCRALSMAMDPKGGWLAIGDACGHIIFRRLPSLDFEKSLSTHGGAVTDLAIDAEGKTLAAAIWWNEEGYIVAYDINTGQEVMMVHDKNTLMAKIQLSPDGTRLVKGERFKKIHIWSVPSGLRAETLIDIGRGPFSFSANGRELVTVSREGLRFFSSDGRAWR